MRNILCMDLGLAAFKLARKASGMSQVELAIRSGVSLATIQNIEANRCNPEWRTVAALAESLGLEITLFKKSLNWDALADLGCPIMDDSAASAQVTPTRSALEGTLQVLGVQIQGLKSQSREASALASWLSGVRDHYPSVWRKVPPPLEKWLSTHSSAISPKLRRLALERLGRYL